MVLANQLQQKVISIDLSEAFVMEVGINAAARNLSHLIEPRCGDMTVLDAAPRSVDLIWAEGSIYCVGFDKALKTWRPYLADGGVVACSELSWLTATPAPEAAAFWKTAYPAARSVAENVIAAELLGYECLHTFVLPPSCWWDEYYTPLLANAKKLQLQAQENDFLAKAIANANAEIDLFRRCHNDYGYVFYLLRKSNISIQHATADDAEELAKVFRKSIGQALPFLPTLHTPDEDRQYFSERILPEQEVYLARDQHERVIGFIALSDHLVSHLYLVAEATNVGIGTRLLNIAKLLRAKLKLWTFQKNDKARRFYANRGFRVVKETDGAGNEEKEPDVLLEWSKAEDA